MSRAPRGLTPEEAALWAKVSATVTPMRKNPPRTGEGDQPQAGGGAGASAQNEAREMPGLKPRRSSIVPHHHASHGPPPPRGEDRRAHSGLDSHWERRLARSSTAPDFTLDLHGHTLDQAHARLDRGIAQARAMDARLVLVITGKPRPVDSADRGERRGAIRAKILDWLAAGPHAQDIAAVKQAHRRHGGEGALYLVLKRNR